jgi:prepilin peptidase CpaA
MVPPTLIVAATIVFVSMCIAFDVRTLRIPNLVTGPAILLGTAANCWLAGWSGLEASAVGFAMAVGLLLVPFALGGIGGGDVKMMGAVGAFLGPALTLQSLLVGLMAGGCFAAVHLARKSRLREKLLATAHMFVQATMTQSLEPLRAPAAAPGAIVLPYSVPLGLGTMIAIVVALVAAP